MTKTKKAFTLIELMVVVAIIAVLATLAVSNFTAATRRARNATRVSDIKTVATALETCANASDGTYHDMSTLTGTTATKGGGAGQTPYNKDHNPCLNDSVIPKVANYDYTFKKVTNAGRDAWVLCAQLEKVANWEGVGNSTIPANNNSMSYDPNTGAWNSLTKCGDPSVTPNCYFCVFNQQ